MGTALNATHASTFDNVIKLIDQNLSYIGFILSAITFVVWVAGFRPGHDKKSQECYFDYDSNKIVERKTFLIHWGHVFFFKKIKLSPIERDAQFSILCKPLGGIKNTLHGDNYEVNSSGSKTKITLVNKEHFVNNEIETIYVETTRQAPAECTNNIDTVNTDTTIEIYNRNHVEVRNFRLTLPDSVKIDDMIKYKGVLTDWKTSGGNTPIVTAIVDRIPPNEGEKPGKKVIPIL